MTPLNRPIPGAHFYSGATGQYPLVLQGLPGGGDLEGMTRRRGVRDMSSHQDLCRAFGLSEVRYFFDLPSSMRNIGSNRASRSDDGVRRIKNGYVFEHGKDKPVATVRLIEEGDRLHDVDPRSFADLADLSHA